jgi:CheY-like chemotaxis protein
MSLKVLIAEDEDDIADQYKMVLEELGHEVERVKDGEECIRKFHEALENNYKDRPNPYDVILMDYFMPIKDGIEAAKVILEECPKQRIIFVTGHGPKLLSGLNDFEDPVEILVKPVPLTALIAKIENRRQKEIAKKLYYKLKKWDGTDGLSTPTGPTRAVEKINVFPD